MSDKFDDYDDEDKILEDEYFDEDEPTEDDYEDEQESPNSRKGALNKSSEKEEDKPDEEYENVCFICRRPESITGKQFKLPNGIFVCDDCMHKTMDAVSQFDYQGMLSDPSSLVEGLNKMNLFGETSGEGEDDEKKKVNIPHIRFVNISDLQGSGGIPNKQKLKKRKKKPSRPPEE